MNEWCNKNIHVLKYIFIYKSDDLFMYTHFFLILNGTIKFHTSPNCTNKIRICWLKPYTGLGMIFWSHKSQVICTVHSGCLDVRWLLNHHYYWIYAMCEIHIIKFIRWLIRSHSILKTTILMSDFGWTRRYLNILSRVK